MGACAVIWRTFTDVALLLLLLVPAMIFLLLPDFYPNETGFYCDDRSLDFRKPTSPSVSALAMLLTTFGLPAILIPIVEGIRYVTKTGERFYEKLPGVWGKMGLPAVIFYIFKSYGMWLFSVGFAWFFSDVTRFVLGRPVPYFHESCGTRVTAGLKLVNMASYRSTGACGGRWLYPDDYSCANKLDRDDILELRGSFPAPFVVLATTSMVWTALYLQGHVRCVHVCLFRPLVQLTCLGLAWTYGLSRWLDHYNHFFDILIGFIIGTIIPVLVVWGTSGLLTNRPTRHDIYERMEEMAENNVIMTKQAILQRGSLAPPMTRQSMSMGSPSPNLTPGAPLQNQRLSLVNEGGVGRDRMMSIPYPSNTAPNRKLSGYIG